MDIGSVSSVRRPRRIVAGAVAGLATVMVMGLGAAPVGAESGVTASAAWRLTSSPNRSTGSILWGVSCANTTRCVAVGSSGRNPSPPPLYQTQVETLSAGAWTVTPSPNRPSFNQFLGVSCPTSARCFAAGSTFDQPTGFDTSLIEKSNGTAWSIMASPNRGNQNLPAAIDCVDTTHCVAVGTTINAAGHRRTLILTMTGSTWVVTASPNRGALDNWLARVDCTDATHCVAVGHWHNATSDQDRTLILRRNGGAWARVTSPNRGTSFNRLFGVSCASASRCVAAGVANNTSTGHAETLVETWAGTSWTIMASPNRAGVNNELDAVSCPTTGACVAVGASGLVPNIRSLVETLSAGTWKLTASPYRGGSRNFVESVSCRTAAHCVAVGYSQSAANTYRTEILTNG